MLETCCFWKTSYVLMNMASGNQTVSLREARLQHIPGPLQATNDLRMTFKKVVDLTRGTPIGGMHWKDRSLLNRELHERPELMATSCRFHYGTLAELYNIPREETRLMNTAEQVLNYVVAREMVELNVADLLIKLEQSGRCYDVVRKLVQQIYEREQTS